MATHGLPAWPWAEAATDDLPRAERLLLEAFRLAADAARRGCPTHPALSLPFIAEDAAAALAGFEALLRALAPGGPLPVAAPLCPRVSRAEAALLLGCAMAQHGRRVAALALILPPLPALAARAALPAAIRLGALLRGAGLVLRDPLHPARLSARR